MIVYKTADKNTKGSRTSTHSNSETDTNESDPEILKERYNLMTKLNDKFIRWYLLQLSKFRTKNCVEINDDSR